MCGWYEMIFVDAYVRHGESQSGVSFSLQRSFESAAREPWPMEAKKLPGEDRLNMFRQKRTQGAKKLWVSIAVFAFPFSVRLSVTHLCFDTFREKKRCIYFCKKKVSFLDFLR